VVNQNVPGGFWRTAPFFATSEESERLSLTKVLMQREKTGRIVAKGFVYIFSNASMPGLLKVGFTAKVPTERAMELNTTGVPSPFQVEYYCLVEEAATLEAAIHRELAPARQNADREFFRLSLDAAIKNA
jgi:hypothetical protein